MERQQNIHEKIILSIVIIGIATLVFAACSGIAGDSAGSDSNTVHMTDSTFGRPSITIAKGSKLTLISDTSQAHIIDNGTWSSDGLPHPKIEPGAPVIKDAQFLDNSPQSFGPFNTPGTYQLYCTIHTGMNLTVIVK
ncbi:MAG: hypothetical protein NVS4B1_24110 [Ktedonobacteraceae bacterium]